MYSFVDASLLDEDNSIQDVARRGFKVGPRGLKFVLGNFRWGGEGMFNIENFTELPPSMDVRGFACFHFMYASSKAFDAPPPRFVCSISLQGIPLLRGGPKGVSDPFELPSCGLHLPISRNS